MQFIKGSINNIAFAVFELVVGILLLINPDGFTTGIIILAGAMLMISGLINVYKYIAKDAIEAMEEQYMSKGLIAVLAGLFCAFQTEWFLDTFPLLTTLYGVAIFVLGVLKIQLMFDMLRLKHKKWTYAGANAVFTIVCAVLILSGILDSTDFLWIFIGITLIIEAVLDVVTIVLSYKATEAQSYEIIEK